MYAYLYLPPCTAEPNFERKLKKKISVTVMS